MGLCNNMLTNTCFTSMQLAIKCHLILLFIKDSCNCLLLSVLAYSHKLKNFRKAPKDKRSADTGITLNWEGLRPIRFNCTVFSYSKPQLGRAPNTKQEQRGLSLGKEGHLD